MPFAWQWRADISLLAAATRRLISVCGGARFSAVRQHRRGVLTPISNQNANYFALLLSVIFPACQVDAAKSPP
jgi:hypothetical protein